MKIALHICLALAIGFGLLWGMRTCDPFSYLNNSDTTILKGAVAR